MGQSTFSDSACTLWRHSFSVTPGLLVCAAFIQLAGPSAIAQPATARWARHVGGVDDDYGWATAANSNGDVYVTGYFNGTAGSGPTNFTSRGGQDIFVVRFDKNGNLIWAAYAGGPTNDQGRAIATDEAGNSYLAGHFANTGVFGTNVVSSRGLEDLFVARLDNAGRWLWVTTAGGTNTDEGLSIAVDAAGNSYVAGILLGTSSFGETNLTSRGQSDIMLAKCDPSGRWLWAWSGGGPGIDEPRGVAVDREGNCYVTGYFTDSAAFGNTNLVSRGGSDIFLAKFNSDGALLWVRQAGGAGADEGHAIALDSAGNPTLTGGFVGLATFGNTNIFAGGFAGTMDVFVARFTPAGELVWIQRAGGSNQDAGNAIAVDAEANSYVTGLFIGTASFGTNILTSSSGQADVFFTKYGSTGTLLWAFQSGGPAYMSGHGIAVDGAGSSYATGFFRSNTRVGGLSLTNSSAGRDAFVVRVDGPPRLSIRNSGTAAVLSWPWWATNYQLQSATTFPGGSGWLDVTNARQTNLEEVSVNDDHSGPRRLFRLRKP